MYKIKIYFLSKNPFVIPSLQSKVMGKTQRGVKKGMFFDIFKHPL